MNILDTLFSHAAQNPDQLALDGKEKLTYREFTQRVLTIASRIPLGSKTFIALPQSADAYASMYASLYRGGCYSCLNLSSPPDKAEQVLKIFNPDTILCDASTFERYSDVLNHHLDPRDISTSKDTPERRRGERAYVLFTSGSTGLPKGVIIRTESLEHYTQWAVSHYKAGLNDRWSQHPNIAFDLSVLDIYAALCSGATLIPITEKMHRLMPATAIKDLKITVWNSVPSVVDLMIQSKRLDATHLATLRIATFCGEPLKPHHLEALFAAQPDLIAFNTYGPTEATVSCTSLKLDKSNFKSHCDTSVAIGDAISGMRIHLVGGESDSEGQIVISGAQIAEGYLQDSTRTQEAFRLLEIKGEKVRAYFTGDWAIQKGKDLYCAGRMDNQIKIHGYRVELGEIDSALQAFGLTSAAALFLDGKIHACLVSDKAIAKSALLTHLKQHLEPYAVPEVFLRAKALPRNSNDKIDMKTLKDWVQNGSLDVIE